jgi:hypothetical protein
MRVQKWQSEPKREHGVVTSLGAQVARKERFAV